MTTDALDPIASSNLPLMTHLNDEPSRLDTLDAWEQHLADLLSQPDSLSRRLSVQRTKTMIAEMRAEET